MKKLLYFTLLIGGLFVFNQSAKAQVNVNINLGSQPMWESVGYEYVRYYYIPEIDVYYDVASRRYTYLQGNRWVTKSKLPGRYKKFDIYRSYKVVINDRNPWHYHSKNRSRYGHYASHRHQPILRDAPHHHHGRGGHVVERKAPSKHVKHYKKDKNHKKNNNHKHSHKRS